MNLPAGVSEKTLLAAIDKIGGILSAKVSFGSHTEDDIRQMVAVFALEALPRYDSTKGNIEGYLYRHCANRLSNARRDETGARNDPPCAVCFEAEFKGGPGHPDGSICSLYREWRDRQNRKATLALRGMEGAVDEVPTRGRPHAETSVEGRDLAELIDKSLPIELRKDYLQMLAGVQVAKKRRTMVQQAVAEILEQAGVATPAAR